MRNFRNLGLAALATATMIASAQAQVTTTPNANLNFVLRTDGTGTVTSGNPLGIGYGGPNQTFAAAPDQNTSQSYFNGLNVDTTVAAGSDFQLGVYAYFFDSANNRAGSTTIYASLFELNNVATGNINNQATGIDLGATIFQNIAIGVTESPDNTPVSQIYYSNTFTLGSAINANQSYALAISGSSIEGDTGLTDQDSSYVLLFRGTNYVAITETNFPGQANIRPENNNTDARLFRTIYGFNNNEASFQEDNEVGFVQSVGTPTTFSPGAQPFAYQFLAGSSAVPEPSSVAFVAITGAFVGGLVVRRRLRK